MFEKKEKKQTLELINNWCRRVAILFKQGSVKCQLAATFICFLD